MLLPIPPQISKSQGKFQMSLGAEGNHNPHHGIRVEVSMASSSSKYKSSAHVQLTKWLQATTIVVLNALGYIGFKVNSNHRQYFPQYGDLKVIATSGDLKEYLWTLERNLDADHQFKSLEESFREWSSILSDFWLVALNNCGGGSKVQREAWAVQILRPGITDWIFLWPTDLKIASTGF